jgi:circadian clock protein KaiC
LIDDQGFSVLPSTSMGLNHQVSSQRISSGVKELDDMLEGKGYFRGSSVMVSGTAGSGKSSLAAHFANQTCIDGKRCLHVAFEESPAQTLRNMRSIGIDLAPHVKKGLLRMEAWRPTQSGLEMHLLRIHKLVEQFNPRAVIVDPITNLVTGDTHEVHAMLMRLLDFLKTKQITAFFTALTEGGAAMERTEVQVSSLIDTWMLVRDVELNGERNRCLYVLKSRGMANSNQVREFVMTRNGIRLLPVYVGSGTVLTGSARLSQQAREKADETARLQEAKEKNKILETKRKILEAKVAALRAEFADEEDRLAQSVKRDEQKERSLARDVAEMASLRGSKAPSKGRGA